MPAAQTKLAKYIANLGYGSRREVMAMLRDQRVTRRDGRILSEGDVFQHDDLLIDGKPADPPPGSILMMHKPVGYICSTKGAHHLVYDLLPARFLARSPVMAPIGRLDLDSSGLLLLTDDGKVNHRITSPRKHLPKVYDVHLAEDLTGKEARVLASGTMLLESDVVPLKPVELEVISPRHVRVTLTEGRYHQVRRMFAAFGNHVTALHRTAIGNLALGDLRAGEWRVLKAAERKLLLG
ncbi:MAG TPA: pseudouridine synthase [Gemmatimonadaceae bacterium]|nr:pseudouridine synthase [Gemmatimonadaceae bacterium]